ncbi:hypothetical protein [Lysobacter enzymogenes]|uniref:hypothetical protein n=1 Tax=Lysobacter enzymogenes TaxID=69 RepID=UPI001A95FDEC|nr:hypothetical protein [Lysobacter enzymogenes]QQP96543.1 hypothetical protein JHW38_00345 [Lysobacter enzymogenes]
MSKEREIIFEPHPVTPERKAKLLAAGYQIIDAIYAPADYVHPDSVKKPRATQVKAEPKAA